MQQPFKKKNLKLLIVRHSESLGNTSSSHAQSDVFHKISIKISNKLGSAWAFYVAVLVIVTWGLSGPLFKFSDTWQLVINTGTTIVTFLMVFVIQNTQNRDGRAMQLKLDELINTTRGARSEFVDLEDLTDAELDELQNQFRTIHEKMQSKNKTN